MVILIILIGFFFRLYHIDTAPLRGDEAFSVQYWAGQPLAISLTQTATIEPHPALNYVLFRAWGLLTGLNPFSMRLLPALTNILGIAALYAISRLFGSDRVGLLAALIFALHPFEIWHAQDVRNYAIWAGASAITLALGLHTLRTRRVRDWIVYSLAAAVTANIFYFEWFTIAAFGLYVLLAYWKNGQVVGRWVIGVLPAILTSAASFVMLQGNLVATGNYGGTTASKLDWLRLFSWFVPTLTFGDTLPVDLAAALWPFIAFAFLVGTYIVWRNSHKFALFIALLAFVPLALLAAASSRLNIFDPRYMLSAVPAYVLLIAVSAVQPVGQISGRKILSILIGVGWFVISGYSLYIYFLTDYTKSQNWPALTTYLESNVSKSDLVIQLSVDPAFGYYYHAAADAPALPEKPSQPADEIRNILTQDSTRYESVWIVGQTFPDWPNAGVVESWLNDHMQRVRGGQIDGLKYEQFLQWPVSPDEITAQPLATFGDAIQLIGERAFLPPERNGNLTVWLYWKPVKTTSSPLKIFVHLLGDINPATGTPLWTQDDHYPQNGRVGTTEWTPGTIYRDVYNLPIADVPNGMYALNAGFYNPDTGNRLLVGDDDNFSVQTLELK